MIKKKSKKPPLTFKTYINKHEIETTNYTIVYDNPHVVLIKTSKSIIKLFMDEVKEYYKTEFNEELNINDFIHYKLPIICEDLFEFGDIYNKDELIELLISKFGVSFQLRR